MQDYVHYIASIALNPNVSVNPNQYLSQGRAGPSQGTPPNPSPSTNQGQAQPRTAPSNTAGQEASTTFDGPSQPNSSQGEDLGYVRVQWPEYGNGNPLRDLHHFACVSGWKEAGVSVAADLSRDDVFAAVASGGQVVVRDAKTSEELRLLTPERGTQANASEMIRDLAFTEDSMSIITAGLSGIIYWDLQSGQLKKSRECKGARSVSTSSASGLFATGNDDSIVHVWKKDFMLARTLGDHVVPNASVRALDFSRSGTKLVVGTDRASLSSWDISTGRTDVVFRGHEASITSAKISKDERGIVSSDVAGLIRLWDARSPRNGFTMNHGSFVSSVAYSFDNFWVLSGGSNGCTNFWDLRNCKPVALIENRGPVVKVRHSILGSSYMVMELGGVTRVWTYYLNQSN